MSKVSDTPNFSIEQLESLASQIDTEIETERQRLARLIRAYARIAAAGDPKQFSRRATELCDEPTSNGSYPPDQEPCNWTGPLSVVIADPETEEVPDSGEYYHSWRRVTTMPGLCVDDVGDLYLSTESGTGSLGQFAAHPGDHNVHITIEFERAEASEVDLDHLRLAEEKLRVIAFPLVAKRLAKSS